MPLVLGYFFQTFENGIGNISSPTINFLSAKSKVTTVDNIIVSGIYFFWFMAQIILLIVLLNFVIALISQYYEDVMNSKVQHTYEMRQELNHEYNLYCEFKVKMGWKKDKRIDSIILVDGEQQEDDGEWKGLT